MHTRVQKRRSGYVASYFAVSRPVQGEYARLVPPWEHLASMGRRKQDAMWRCSTVVNLYLVLPGYDYWERVPLNLCRVWQKKSLKRSFVTPELLIKMTLLPTLNPRLSPLLTDAQESTKFWPSPVLCIYLSSSWPGRQISLSRGGLPPRIHDTYRSPPVDSGTPSKLKKLDKAY